METINIEFKESNLQSVKLSHRRHFILHDIISIIKTHFSIIIDIEYSEVVDNDGVIDHHIPQMVSDWLGGVNVSTHACSTVIDFLENAYHIPRSVRNDYSTEYLCNLETLVEYINTYSTVEIGVYNGRNY